MKKVVIIIALLLLAPDTEAQKRGNKGRKPTPAPRPDSVARPAVVRTTTTTTTTTTTPPPPSIDFLEEDTEEEVQTVERITGIRNTCPDALKPKETGSQPESCICHDQLEDGAVLLECSRLVSAQQLKDIFETHLKGQSIDGLDVRNSTLGSLLPSQVGVSHIPTLLLRNNEISSIDDQTFDKISKSIVRLDLSANKIAAVPFEIFDNFTQLQVLNLGENQLTSIDTLGHSSSLRVLYLYSNQIDTIATDAFAHLPSLEVLDLRWNNLRTLPPGSLHVTSARWQLRLRSNQLSTLEDAFAQGYLPFLVELSSNNIEILTDTTFGPLAEAALLEGSSIYLEGNPLNCDCPIAWLVRNSTLLHIIEGGICEGDGTAVVDLRPADYSHCPLHRQWMSPFLQLLPEFSENSRK